jgi:hypothetical protein
MKKEDFEVITITIFNEDTPDIVHWSEGLEMYIYKDGKEMMLNSDEIVKLIKTLPRTFGGVY